MVSVLAIVPKVRMFKHAGGDGLLRETEIGSTRSSEEGVKPEDPRRNILRHVKNHLKIRKKYFAKPNSHSFRPFLLLVTR
jgi:hypothetical protein